MAKKISLYIFLFCGLLLSSCGNLTSHQKYVQFYVDVTKEDNDFRKNLREYTKISRIYLAKEKSLNWKYIDTAAGDTTKQRLLQISANIDAMLKNVSGLTEIDEEINLKQRTMAYYTNFKVAIDNSSILFEKLFKQGSKSLTDEDCDSQITSLTNIVTEMNDLIELRQSFIQKHKINSSELVK